MSELEPANQQAAETGGDAAAWPQVVETMRDDFRRPRGRWGRMFVAALAGVPLIIPQEANRPPEE